MLYKDGPLGLELNFLTYLQNLASVSKVYSLQWNHDLLKFRSKDGLTFDENHRIASCSDSRDIQIWESISFIESYSKCISVSEIWFSLTDTKVSPCKTHLKLKFLF